MKGRVGVSVFVVLCATASPVSATDLASVGVSRSELAAARAAAEVDPYLGRLFDPARPKRPSAAEFDCSGFTLASIDGVESLFGPGNVGGVVGNGRLAAGFAPEGELTVLRWPNPSTFDQVSYLTPFLQLACETRKLPRNGALENMGAFAGLAYETAGGAGVTWLRDPPWTHRQGYAGDASAVLVTEHARADLGLRVRVEALAEAERDVLAMRYEVSRAPGSPVVGATFLFFENLDPANDRIPYLPLQDQLFDPRNDFAALYHAGRGAVVHFRPATLDPDYARGFLGASQAELDAWADSGALDAHFGDEARNVHIAVGLDRAPSAHQVGIQTNPTDAYADAADGALSGAGLAVGLASAALAAPLDLTGEGDAVRVLLAHAHTALGALDLLEEARGRPHEAMVAASDAWWRDYLAPAPVPNVADPGIRAFARRAVISLRQGYATESGAIVASIATQPPYALHWPRDGFFFAHALDAIGHPELAERSHRFVAAAARDCAARSGPVCENEPQIEGLFGLLAGRPIDWPLDGTWDMNYYSDGAPGGPLLFEIDNAGLTVWGFWDHATFLPEAERERFLCGSATETGVWPAMRKAALGLAACRDADSGLQCYAMEDDNPVPTRGLQGAVTVWMALKGAALAGEVCGEDPAVVATIADRRDELAAAIEANFLETEGPDAPYYPGGGAAAWLLWPAEFPMSEEVRDNTARALFRRLEEVARKEVVGSSYDSKTTLALARIGWDTGDPEANLDWALRTLAAELPSPGARHLGEVYLAGDFDGDGETEWAQRTALPHLWNQSLLYLSLLAKYGAAPPEAAGGGSGGGCGCTTVGAGGASPALESLGALLLAALALRLRPRGRVS